MPFETDEESGGIAELKQANKIQPHIAINDSSDIQLNSFRDFLIKNRGYILFALTSMLLIYRNNLQPLNFLIVIILVFWAIIRLTARTTIFSKGELLRDKPSLKRKTKIFSLVMAIFITFIIISSALFLNFSPQVGGDSQPYEDSPNYRDGTFQNSSYDLLQGYTGGMDWYSQSAIDLNNDGYTDIIAGKSHDSGEWFFPMGGTEELYGKTQWIYWGKAEYPYFDMDNPLILPTNYDFFGTDDLISKGLSSTPCTSLI